MQWPAPPGAGWRGIGRLAVAFCVGATPVAAQSVGGRLTTDDSGIAVAGAFVSLLDADERTRRRAVSDSSGRFLLVAPSAGRYRVRVEHAAFFTVLTNTLPLDAGQAIEFDLRLPRRQYALEPITVMAPAPVDGPLAGFYERKAKGWGVFITRAEIEKRGANKLQDLFHGIPDVSVQRISDLESTIRMGTEFSRVNVGPLSLGETGTPQVAGLTALPCSPIMYVDGMEFGRVDEVMDQVSPGEVEGIEVYRRAGEVPHQYGGIYAHCGVILVWTRRATPR
jgi:hypothetical protein